MSNVEKLSYPQVPHFVELLYYLPPDPLLHETVVYRVLNNELEVL